MAVGQFEYIGYNEVLDNRGAARQDRYMLKRSRIEHTRDVNELAASIVSEAVGDSPEIESKQPQKNPAAVALGHLGGKKGGKARAAKLTAEQRSAIARRAAQIRWSGRS